MKLERFNEKYEVADDGCWIWTGARVPDGYGHFRYELGSNPIGAHVASYKLHCGEVPSGTCVLHSCDIPACVNPMHLFLGTKQDNSDDKFSKDRHVSCPGEANGSAILTEDSVRQIRTLLATGDLTQAAIGRLFGVTRYTIWNIKHGKKWGWLQ